VTTRVALAYGATSLGAALMQNVFITYYVHLFMSVFGLDANSFYVGQVIYMIWNSVNDPLFGYLFLKARMHPSSSSTQTSTPLSANECLLTKQARGIRYGSAVWVFSFVMLFFPWTSDPTAHPWLVMCHFVLSICLYDGALSYVLLAHSSMLADLTTDSSERAKCNTFSSVCGVIGSLSILFSHRYWDVLDLRLFRCYAIVLGLLAFLAMQFCANTFDLGDEVTRRRSRGEQHTSAEEHARRLRPAEKLQIPPLRLFLSQLLTHRNFWLWVTINLVQVFNCHYNSNFMAIFLDAFLPATDEASWHTFSKASVLSLTAVLPHVGVILCASVVARLGVWKLLRQLYVFKLLTALAELLLGIYVGLHIQQEFSHPTSVAMLFLFFVLLNKVSNEVICRHGNLVVANLVDEDMLLHQRSDSLSTLLFGVNAFFTKPGQSFAPMIGWRVLAYFDKTAQPGETEQGDVLGAQSATHAMFLMWTFVPLLCAIAQLLLWARFDLRADRLQRAKLYRARLDGKSEDAFTV